VYKNRSGPGRGSLGKIAPPCTKISANSLHIVYKHDIELYILFVQ
jgi:hypothetical protein